MRQLTYFEAVVRWGGFSRAAEQLHIAQPAVSAQVKRLEAELGVVLLERTTRRVALTHAGELFLARARAVLDQLERARDDLDALAVIQRGHLRIGATEALGSIDLPRSLAQFHRLYPGVTLTLRTGLIAELLADLDSGVLDVVLGPIHHDLPATYIGEPLVAENIVLLAPPDRHLAADTTTLAAVQDQQFVCLPAGSGLHTILLAAAAAEGFTPRITFEAHSPANVRQLVAAGLGVALVAESTANAAGPAVRVHALTPAPPHPPIGTIRARGHTQSPALGAWQQQLGRNYRAG